jgi:CubicO group peptidase (beta-lactamase class C family)
MRKVIQSIIVAFVILGFLAVSGQAEKSLSKETQARQTAATNQGPADPAELESFIDGIMTAHMRTHHIAGATFSLVKNGEALFAKGYGYADIKGKRPVIAEETLFRPGSVSKLFTWTAVMQLIEQGKLDLKADINNYLTKFKIPETYPEPITLAHLMTHTPGFEEMVSGMGARSPEDLVPLGDFLQAKLPARVFPPGELTAYSNFGSALAGYIVQVVSGVPFEDYIEKNIYEPLGMSHSTFRQPLPSHLADKMSVGYSFEDGVFKAQDFELINGMAPAGSMSTTATDMARFMIAHLQYGKYGENRILEEETAREMQTLLFTHDKRVNGNAHGFWELKLNDLRTIGHGGDTAWFHTLLILIPERNLGFFVSYNSLGGGGLARDQLLQAFLDRYYPAPEMPELKPSPDFKKRAKRYTGSYKLARTVFTTYEKLMALMMKVDVKFTDEGTLFTPIPGGFGDKQWVEVEPRVFRELGGQDTLVFRENNKGRITHAFISSWPYFALIKMAWHETQTFHFSLLVITMILFLSTLIWPGSALFRILCRRKREEKKGPRLARWLVGVMSAFYLLFVVGLLMVLSDPMELMYGVPFALKVFLVFPIIAAVLTIGALAYAVLAWKKKYWTGCGRLHFTLIVLASLVFIWFLNYWNLFGFRF